MGRRTVGAGRRSPSAAQQQIATPLVQRLTPLSQTSPPTSHGGIDVRGLSASIVTTWFGKLRQDCWPATEGPPAWNNFRNSATGRKKQSVRSRHTSFLDQHTSGVLAAFHDRNAPAAAAPRPGTSKHVPPPLCQCGAHNAD